jgi:probable rRNA maturation factor|uniref:rRNA maturation RNase YbeY n=1 Tax=candidate division WOR-3 bacterium TaxID=2052148 RepID=A0A7V3RGJ3_UNCW3
MKKKKKSIKIEVFNLAKAKGFSYKIIKKLVNYVAKKENLDNIKTLNVIIADAQYLKNLNRQFFYRNTTTNVISFNLGEIGEIYISNDEVKDLFDFYYYLAHGLLHIVGYDDLTKKDEKIMNKKVQEYLEKILI